MNSCREPYNPHRPKRILRDKNFLLQNLTDNKESVYLVTVSLPLSLSTLARTSPNRIPTPEAGEIHGYPLAENRLLFSNRTKFFAGAREQ